MRPRPASRKKPLVVVPAAELAQEIEPLKRARTPPVAIVSGRREWLAVRLQPEAREWFRVWPGLEETFCDLPVIIRSGFGAPRVIRTQDELEDILLEGVR